MKPRFLGLFILLFIFIFSSYNLRAEELIIENFEDGNFTEAPNWWTFDSVKLEIVSNPKDGPASLQNYWLKITGPARDWYLGGFGVELKIDGSKYDAVELDIFGTGSRSGRLKIELYDDDNNNQEIEQDEAKNYAPIFDDRWVYEQKVNWHGWRTITVPFSQFTDDNPGVGNDKFDPLQKDSSAGLVNFQLILIATSKTGSVDLSVDNIQFIKISNPK